MNGGQPGIEKNATYVEKIGSNPIGQVGNEQSVNDYRKCTEQVNLIQKMARLTEMNEFFMTCAHFTLDARELAAVRER